MGPRRITRAVLTRTGGTLSRPMTVEAITATTASMKPIRISGRSPRPNMTISSG